MKLNEEQINEAIEMYLASTGIVKYIKDDNNQKIRDEHEHKGVIFEAYANTATVCGDQRKEIFGICLICKKQIYHKQNIVIMELLYPLEFVNQ